MSATPSPPGSAPVPFTFESYAKRLVSVRGAIAGVVACLPFSFQFFDYVPPHTRNVVGFAVAAGLLNFLFTYIVGRLILPEYGRKHRLYERLLMLAAGTFFVLAFCGLLAYPVLDNRYVERYGKGGERVVVGTEAEYRGDMARVIERVKILLGKDTVTPHDLMQAADFEREAIWNTDALRRHQTQLICAFFLLFVPLPMVLFWLILNEALADHYGLLGGSPPIAGPSGLAAAT